jgi:polyhydroxybutyrate depolymerase
MMRRAVTIIIAAVLATSGCATSNSSDDTEGALAHSESLTLLQLDIGTTTHEITVGSVQRSFIVTVPATVGGAFPLVFMLHGGFGSADQAQADYDWTELAVSEGFIAVFPDGVGRTWNAGSGCCGPAATANIDDVTFITALTDWITERAPIDSDRVFATGISNGGMMAYRLACSTDIFAAIGPVAATMLDDCESPSPLSIMHIHGLSDESVRPDGEPGTGRAVIDGPPLDELHAEWLTIDQCAKPAVTNRGDVTTSTASCDGGRSVDFITIADAGHQWPGADRKPGREKILGTDPPSTALEATATLWAFFESHPRTSK